MAAESSAGGSAWSWHLVAPILKGAGHQVLAPSLPCDDDGVGLKATIEQVNALVEPVGEGQRLVVVGHSLGGLVAQVVARDQHADLLVMVAPMIPVPGESGADWWANTKHHEFAPAEFNPVVTFLHDVPADIAEEAGRQIRKQTDAIMQEPCPLKSWPDCRTVVIAGRHDRFFPLEFIERTAADRLSLTADEIDVIDSGHLPMLDQPEALAERLLIHLASS